MCGIVGVISCLFGSKNRKFMADGILTGQVRGLDSTGLMLMDFAGNIKVHKSDLTGTDFFYDKGTDDLLNVAGNARAIFVHHRAATQGKISTANAHPFVASSTDNSRTVVGVHNGSLTNWRSRPNSKNFEVDSNWAFHRIAERGDEGFEEIEGPYAMVWMDRAKNNEVNIARNSGRPLHGVLSKDGRQLFVASEVHMLKWLVERNDIEVAADYIVFDAGKIFTIDTSGNTIRMTVRDTPAIKALPAVVTSTATVTNINARKNVVPKYVGAASSVGTAATSSEETVVRNGYTVSLTAASFISKLERALKGIKTSTYTSATAAKKDEPAEEMVRQRDDDAPFAADDKFEDELVPEKWISHHNATTKEVEAAKQAGVFRELNWLEGVCYDTNSQELLGDVDVYLSGKGKTKFLGVLRGCSEARANAEYINNKVGWKGVGATLCGGWVVVVGMADDAVLGKKLIVAELTREGKAQLDAVHMMA